MRCIAESILLCTYIRVRPETDPHQLPKSDKTRLSGEYYRESVFGSLNLNLDPGLEGPLTIQFNKNGLVLHAI